MLLSFIFLFVMRYFIWMWENMKNKSHCILNVVHETNGDFYLCGCSVEQLRLQLLKNDGPTSDWWINRAPGQSHAPLREGKPKRQNKLPLVRFHFANKRDFSALVAHVLWEVLKQELHFLLHIWLWIFGILDFFNFLSYSYFFFSFYTRRTT